MFNRNYEISQAQIADLFLFPHRDEYACQQPLESKWESNALEFWNQPIGKTTTDWEGLKATTIRNPSIRYLHRILASTIFGRENTGNVNYIDFFLIYRALSETKVNPTSFLLAHLQFTSVKIEGPICVGRMITSIALALNIGTELDTLEPLETHFSDLDYFRIMRLIKNKPEGKYF